MHPIDYTHSIPSTVQDTSPEVQPIYPPCQSPPILLVGGQKQPYMQVILKSALGSECARSCRTLGHWVHARLEECIAILLHQIADRTSSTDDRNSTAALPAHKILNEDGVTLNKNGVTTFRHAMHVQCCQVNCCTNKLFRMAIPFQNLDPVSVRT